MAKLKYEVVVGDAGSDEVLFDLIKAVRKFGVHVTIPKNDSDMHVFVVSNKKVPREVIKDVMMDDYY